MSRTYSFGATISVADTRESGGTYEFVYRFLLDSGWHVKDVNDIMVNPIGDIDAFEEVSYSGQTEEDLVAHMRKKEQKGEPFRMKRFTNRETAEISLNIEPRENGRYYFYCLYDPDDHVNYDDAVFIMSDIAKWLAGPFSKAFNYQAIEISLWR